MNLDRLNQMAEEYLSDWEDQMQNSQRNPWGRRLVLQLQFAVKLLEAGMTDQKQLIADGIERAYEDFSKQGALTRNTCLEVEQKLKPLQDIAKSLSLICVGHAHIDMNWMWAYDETVAITLDSFRTMLDLMEEYPEFTYAQSQASVYRIVEQHDPTMLKEISRRVQEGRWEITASTWVEADRNMPSAESMVRQLSYTRDYLCRLFPIKPEDLDLDYEPDTFGHHAHVPEILADAGVRYYYHCRGYDQHELYRWQAPSGRSVLVFREPLWYNWHIDGQCAQIAPQFCARHNLKTMLRVYGVGDHGGGPTRRDIEQIIEMNTWPIFPEYRFGTYHDFFRAAEANKDALPLVSGELNFIFDGCYTSQSRIKRGNRMGESLGYQAESAGILARYLTGRQYRHSAHKQAWEQILFNQFHDILPGSGVADTREHAMGLYQQAFAQWRSQISGALRAIDGAIDSSRFAIPEEIRLSRSEGAGVGYPTGSGQVSRVGRHAGRRRLFTVWNPLPEPVKRNCLLTVWDWLADTQRMIWQNDQEQEIPHQVLSQGQNQYWGHYFHNVLVEVEVPALGYTTIILDEKPLETFKIAEHGPRVDRPLDPVLENEQIRVEVSLEDGGILSLIDKNNGQEYVRPDQPMAVFDLINEDPERGMSSWIVGRYREKTILSQGVCDLKRTDGPLRSSISWSKLFGSHSRLETTMSLDQGSAVLEIQVRVLWQEIGTAETGIPQLRFACPTTIKADQRHYAVPMGEVSRSVLDHDVPAIAYGLIPNQQGRHFMLMSDSKYGYRATEDGLALNLIRSSFEPDPWPEVGEHQMRIGLALVEQPGATAIRLAEQFAKPLQVIASKAKKGLLPTSQTLIGLSGDSIVLSAVKASEDGDDLIIRLYNTSGQTTEGSLRLWCRPLAAWLADLHENKLPEDDQEKAHIELKDNLLTYRHAPYALRTLRVRIGKENEHG